MKQLVTGVAIALAVAAIGAPRVYAFSQQTIDNAGPDGSARFVDPDQRAPFDASGQDRNAADPNGAKTINLGGTKFGLSFGNGDRDRNNDGLGSPARDPRMGFTPGDDSGNGSGRTFFGGMPDSLGPN